MAEGGDFDNPDFDNPAFDLDEEDLPDPVLDPPSDVQQQIGNSGDNLQNLRDELRETALQEQKRRLVDAFYNEIARDYGDLRPAESVDYKLFEVDDDGKTLYWTVGGKKIRVNTVKGRVQFRGLGTLARELGAGGTNAIRTHLGLRDYTSSSRRSRLRGEAIAKLQKTQRQLPPASEVDSVPLQDLSLLAERAETTVKEVMTTLTEEEAAALKTIGDPPHDLKVNIREIRGLDKALQKIRGELVNNLAKLSELDKHILREKKKLTEAEDLDEFARRRVAERLRGLEDERGARLEAASANRDALRSQIQRIRETMDRVLNEDTTLADRLRTLFREQGVTLVSLVTALGFIISTLVLALTGGGGSISPTPTPAPTDRAGAKEWVKKHLEALGRALATLAGKAAAALPGIIGSVISWLLNYLSKAAGWLAENLWALVLAVGGLLFAIAGKWLLP